MNDMYSYKGARWYKCDLHLHTTASKCFVDQDVTAEQWVQAAIDKGLNCVAVTDHNNGILIDDIKKAAEDTDLVIFPGVELTCDSSKVHLLIIFDVNKTSADVRDFLARADIRTCNFEGQEPTTTKNIFDIAELAKIDGAIVIPAHIDEYNGLSSISDENLKKFYEECDVNAVQVVHKEFLNPEIQVKGNQDLKSLLNGHYNYQPSVIEETTIKDWFKPVKYAKENNKALLTFSDNPHEHYSPKHGLWGIGCKYSWIKMDEKPSLEGLRQAFLLPEYRIKNIFDCASVPYAKPALWIKSIKISNSTVTAEDEPLKVEFSPQLNTIIGGRGSGKSSILRFIRGVFNRTADLDTLTEILNDHNDFYKIEAGRPKKGVLTDKTKIEIEFVRNDTLHKITASNFTNKSDQTVHIEKFNQNSIWETINDEGYIDFFEFEHYSQKQIYEIAQEPNALRERIDKAIEGLEALKQERERIKSMFLEKSASIRTIDLSLSEKGKIETSIKDVNENIKKLQESGIAELLNAKEKYDKESILIKQFQTDIEERKNKIEKLTQEIDLSNIDLSKFNDEHQKTIGDLVEKTINDFLTIKTELLKLKESAQKIEEDYKLAIDNSEWQGDLENNTSEFNEKKEELERQGIDAISSFEKFTLEKNKLNEKLDKIKTEAIARDDEVKEKDRLQNEYLQICKKITEKRREFLKRVVTGDKVKVNIKPFRNRIDFENRLRVCLQRENTTYQADIDSIMDICFKGNVEKNIDEFRNVFLSIRMNKQKDTSLSGHFAKFIKGLNDAQIDEILLMLPEDEIEVQYKPTIKAAFKSLSTASAGQKTTAILTFILSYGNIPLILDQPEDDLDNRLVFDLVVDRLRQAKEKRQLIVVTHNANIPVNGDAEYINSMDSESRFLRVIEEGTVEQDSIKHEICHVMEGGERAFEMRSKRYQLLR